MLKHITSIQHYTDSYSARILKKTLTMSKNDYCNAVLSGTADYQFKKVQPCNTTSLTIILALGKRANSLQNCSTCVQM